MKISTESGYIETKSKFAPFTLPLLVETQEEAEFFLRLFPYLGNHYMILGIGNEPMWDNNEEFPSEINSEEARQITQYIKKKLIEQGV